MTWRSTSRPIQIGRIRSLDLDLEAGIGVWFPCGGGGEVGYEN